jgi:hypothetical protein
MALESEYKDSAATANAIFKRDVSGDGGVRRLALSAASGGLDNLGYSRGGVYNFSSSITIDNGNTYNGVLFRGTTGASALAPVLPDATIWPGQVLEFKKADSGAGTITPTPAGGQTIDGSPVLYRQFDGVVVRSNGTNWDTIGKYGANEPLAQVITDPGNAGAIPVTTSGRCAITSTGSDTRTLAIPTFVGQQLLLIHAVDGGSVAVTAASAINIAANTIMTATAVRAWILLTGSLTGSTKVWTVTATDGFTLS